MATSQRPLSPHLQIYRWGWTMSLSILHRFTGVILSIGTLLLVAWLLALLQGPDAYARVQQFVSHWVGQTILVGWSFAFYYHLCNGIRHLLWDAGYGFDLPTARRTGAVAVVASALLTTLTWLYVAGLIGGAA